MATVERSVRIVNRAGLHARPCHAIVRCALRYESLLSVAYGSRVVNGRSILELMTLVAPCDAVLTLRAQGEDAPGLIAELAELVEAGFQETD